LPPLFEIGEPVIFLVEVQFHGASGFPTKDALRRLHSAKSGDEPPDVSWGRGRAGFDTADELEAHPAPSQCFSHSIAWAAGRRRHFHIAEGAPYSCVAQMSYPSQSTRGGHDCHLGGALLGPQLCAGITPRVQRSEAENRLARNLVRARRRGQRHKAFGLKGAYRGRFGRFHRSPGGRSHAALSA
jgi:hypothetical protein